MRISLYHLLIFVCMFSSLLSALERTPHPIFVKAKVKSSLLGKDRFLHHYLFEPGDVFDEDKHKHSLKNIEKELQNEGYLNARVADQLTYGKNNRVMVTLSLHPGTRYTISHVGIELTGAPQEEVAAVHEDLQSMVEGDLLRTFFIKEVIDKMGQKIQASLARAGYAKPSLSLTTLRDDKKATVSLIYSLALPDRKLFLFEGNRFYTEEYLLNEVRAVENEGISLVPALIAQDIETMYKKKGFFSVSVSWQEAPGTVIFSIEEGLRSPINGQVSRSDGVSFEYSLQGDGPEPTPLLDARVESVIQKMKADLAALDYYDEDAIEQILSKTSAKLVSLGHWDVVIDKSSPSNVKVCIDIILGKRRMVKRILIEQYPELVHEDLFRRWTELKEAQPIGYRTINKQKRWLEQYVKQRGFLYAPVDYIFQETDEGPLLVWTVDMHEGPVRFGPTTVLGLHKMRSDIIFRERAYQEGDVWSSEKIDQTIRRLRALSMFESVSIESGGRDQQVQPVLIKVVEDDPFEIRTRLGVQFVSKSFTQLSWTTYKVGGSFLWKNPAGIADRLWADLDFTRYTRNVAAQYEIPWIGSLPVRTIVRVYSDRFDQPFISSRNQRLYEEAHDGASLTFQYTHPWWQSCLKVGCELNKLSGISRQAARVIQFEPALIDERNPYFYVEPSITFEHLDDKADPCKGIATTFSFRAMIPEGVKDGWFIRAVLEQSLFYPLFRNVIGAVRWRVGHIFNAKFSTILPTERFYLGGACTVRGYETNMVPPLNDLECDGRCVWVPIGGKSMANINAEIRFPLYKRLSGVFFTDLGILTQDTFADIAANRWFGASGFGVRFATPVGPIRFDIGWKWKKRDPRDRSYAWFLTLGHAF